MKRDSSFPLSLHLAATKVRGHARAQKRLHAGIHGGGEDPNRGQERLGISTAPRPNGPLIWIHIGSEAEALGVPDLIDRLREERGDLAILLSVQRHGPDALLAARLPRDVLVQLAPYGLGRGPAKFLAHWRPNVAIWADNRLEPALIDAANRAGVPILLVDARVPERPGWPRLPGVRRALLKRFRHILAGDERSAEGLRALGVSVDRLEALGFLQEGASPLPCSQAERDMLAEILEARPVWLAADVTAREIEMVTAAHRQAMRRAHRLLLVLVPERVEDGARIAAELEAEGWVVGQRSLDEEPEPEVEILIADQSDELGLWYRLSPVSLIGGTLLGEAREGPRNPYEAAALGSAVLHGPHMGMWRESYARLREAGAARTVMDTASLARAVEYLLAPDKVAEMAAAAWEVTTSGAEATDRVVALVNELLDEQEV